MWLRPGFRLDFQPDSVVFDMDGVLMDNAAIIAFDDEAVRFIFSHLYGLTDSGVPLLPPAAVKAFKAAGGFNDDFDIVYAASSLYNAARLAQPQVANTAQLLAVGPDFGTLMAQQRGGLNPLLATLPAAARPDWPTIERICAEIYWGAAIVRQHLGQEPLYTDHPGRVYDDVPLVGHDLLARLAGIGLPKWGIITGRVTLELDAVLGLLPHPFQQPPVRVTSDIMRKPNPQALLYVARKLGSSGGFYVGDSADDLSLVQHYAAVLRGEANPYAAQTRPERSLSLGEVPSALGDLSFGPPMPPFHAVMIAPAGQFATWQQRGATAIIEHVDQLPALLAGLLGRLLPRCASVHIFLSLLHALQHAPAASRQCLHLQAAGVDDQRGDPVHLCADPAHQHGRVAERASEDQRIRAAAEGGGHVAHPLANIVGHCPVD